MTLRFEDRTGYFSKIITCLFVIRNIATLELDSIQKDDTKLELLAAKQPQIIMLLLLYLAADIISGKRRIFLANTPPTKLI